ncbi:MAG: glycosyl transferase family 2 [Geminicoccaceae bacterium]|jgi:GT2 family glycosyltransferase|nr:glycosyl transferase family 2 [Geminicoccaceae bacterium]MDF2760955.1 glycosyl transferase family 2 [Thermomicrobiales bacterium]
MTFAIMITTHNRCADLRRTCAVLTSLSPPPDEVLICADGCTDDTVSMLVGGFPGFVVLENGERQGSVASRDRMLRLASADIVISLDDDSYPIDLDFLAKVGRVLEAHPEAAVVSFAEIRDRHCGDRPAPPRDERRGRYVAAYANCGAAMRREVYLKLAGFPTFFSHMYEEPDYALQCYGAGLAVWFEPEVAVRHHMSSVNRHEGRRQRLHARNELWSVLIRCPWPYLPIVALFRVWRQLRYAATQGFSDLLLQPAWWLSALRGLPRCFAGRSAVPWQTYWAWMKLARHPIGRRGELLVAIGGTTE